jgi:hypothetical protein
MKVVSKEDNLGKHFIFKEFLDLYVAARQYLAIVSTCKLTVRIDRVKQSFKMDFNESVVSGTTILGSGAILGWLDNVEQEVTLFKKKNGSRIEFIFENDKDEPCTIYGIGGALRIKKMKGTKYGVEEV